MEWTQQIWNLLVTTKLLFLHHQIVSEIVRDRWKVDCKLWDNWHRPLSGCIALSWIFLYKNWNYKPFSHAIGLCGCNQAGLLEILRFLRFSLVRLKAFAHKDTWRMSLLGPIYYSLRMKVETLKIYWVFIFPMPQPPVTYQDIYDFMIFAKLIFTIIQLRFT